MYNKRTPLFVEHSATRSRELVVNPTTITSGAPAIRSKTLATPLAQGFLVGVPERRERIDVHDDGLGMQINQPNHDSGGSTARE
jgi:hypothetical protein